MNLVEHSTGLYISTTQQTIVIHKGVLSKLQRHKSYRNVNHTFKILKIAIKVHKQKFIKNLLANHYLT